MDKKLLDALSNLSEALELIAQTLGEKKAESPTAKALEGGDFSTQIKEISPNIYKNSKYFREIKECMQKECPKELEAKDKIPSIMQIVNKCNKKYNRTGDTVYF